MLNLGLGGSSLLLSMSRLQPDVNKGFQRMRAWWRYPDVGVQSAWPQIKPWFTHRKHRYPAHTYGAQKQTLLRCVDNSKIGREAMAEGRPPRIIHVYSQ